MKYRSILAAFIFLAGVAGARAQNPVYPYSHLYAASLNDATQYACAYQAPVTKQLQAAISAIPFTGGVLDSICYQGGQTITADVWSSVSKNILWYGGSTTYTVNANATIPSNWEICFGSGGSIAAGVGFTLTNNSSPCLGITSGGGTPSGPAGGDLGGTYPDPTVVNLSHVTNSSLANSGLTNPSMTVGGVTCTLGSNCSPSTAPSGAAGGDLGSTYPNPTVLNLSHITNASLPNSGLVNDSLTVNGTPCTLGGSCTPSTAPTGAAGGDLGSTYPNPTVLTLSHVTNASLPNSGLVNDSLTVNGTPCTLGASCTPSTAPTGAAGGDLGSTYPNPTVLTLSHVTNASLPNSGLVNDSLTVNGTPCTLGASCTPSTAPTGAAGGDLAGTYPNPSVAQVNGAALPASATYLGTNSLRQIVTSAAGKGIISAAAYGTLSNAQWVNDATWARGNAVGGSATSGTTLASPAFFVALTNPSLVVIRASGNSAVFPITSVTDTAGNTYQDCGPGSVAYNSSTNDLECFYALNTNTTASNIVTLHFTGTCTSCSISAVEFLGMATSSPVDVYSSAANATSGTAATNNMTVPSVTTTANGEWVIGMFAPVTGGSSVGTSPNWFNQGFAGTAILEYFPLFTAGAIASTAVDATGSDHYAGLQVAFKVGSTPGWTITTTSTDPTFVSGDVGVKKGFGTGACTLQVYCTLQIPEAMVTGYVGAHVATVAGIPNAASSASGIFTWASGENPSVSGPGTDDTTSLLNAWAAEIASPGSVLTLACGGSFVSGALFVETNMHPENGLNIAGCGPGRAPSVLIPTPDFSWTGASTGAIFYDEYPGASFETFAAVDYLSNFYVWGGGNATLTGVPASSIAINLGQAIVFNVTVGGWGGSTTNLTGMSMRGITSLINSSSNGAGSIGCAVVSNGSGGGGNFMAGNDFCSGATYDLQITGGSLVSTGNQYYPGPGSPLSVYMSGSTASTFESTGDIITNSTGQYGVTVSNANAIASLTGDNIQGGISLTAGRVNADHVSSAVKATDISGGSLYTLNSTYTGLTIAGGSVFDLCGNSITTFTLTSGSLYGSCSTTGTLQTASNVATISGWGATSGIVSAVTGSSRKESFTVTATGTPGSGPVLTVTFPVAFYQTPQCSISQVGGTGTLTAPTFPTSIGTSSVSWTFTGTPVAADTYEFQQSCWGPND